MTKTTAGVLRAASALSLSVGNGVRIAILGLLRIWLWLNVLLARVFGVSREVFKLVGVH